MLNRLASKEKTNQCSAVNVVDKALMTSLTDYQTTVIAASDKYKLARTMISSR